MRKNGVFQPLKYYKSTAEALCFTVLLPFFIRLRLNDKAPLTFYASATKLTDPLLIHFFVGYPRYLDTAAL